LISSEVRDVLAGPGRSDPSGVGGSWSRRSRSRLGRIGAIAAAVTLLGGCTDAAGYDLDYIMGYIPFIGTMRSSVAYEAQSMPRLPAEGTIPVMSPAGDVPGAFTQAQLDSAGNTLTNPLPATPEVLARGATVYANQCFVCHGAQGAGNGPVVGVGRFPMGPALNAAATAARSDGYLYGVIRVGRGLMPSYGDRVGHNDRWAVVHYLRDLQRGTGAIVAPATVPAVAPGTPAPAVAPVLEPAAEPAPGA
jgi:mono/diheme cytochrome c family protein